MGIIMDVLEAIVNTLNTIRVSGEQDMSALLGCISALKAMIQFNQQETTPNEEEDGGKS